MKIAICISGQLRYFRQGYASLKKYILKHNACDIFLQTYESDDTDEAIHLIQPKNVLIEKPVADFEIPDLAFKQKFPETNIENMYWMYRNIKKCTDLVNEDYDIIVRTRIDVKYSMPLKIHEFHPDNIYIPAGGNYRGGIFDIFAFSNRNNMIYYAKLFDMLTDYIESGVMAHPETLLKHHLLFGGGESKNVVRFDFPVYLIRKRRFFLKKKLANPPDNP